MEPVLRVQDLTVSYDSVDRRSLTILDGVSFEIAAGEAIGLLGESGCGKSTLALSLLNLLPSSARIVRGSVMLAGVDLLKLSDRELHKVRGARVSIVHQEPGAALNPVMRAGEQIAQVLRAHEPVSRSRAREEAINLLLQLGFASESRVWDAYPHQLSGGQQQRVAIAQAIACRPSLLIADEPTTALDTETQAEILGLLRSLREKLGLAVLLISHDPEVVESFADRVLVMYAGRVVEEGTTGQVMRQALHPYTQGLLRCRLSGERRRGQRRPLETIAGDSPDFAHLPAGCSFEDRCPDRMQVCRTCRPALFQPGDRQVACFKYAP